MKTVRGRYPTRVFITVDTEVAEERLVRGVVKPPLGYQSRIWGRFENQAAELGIRRMMSELERWGLRATFFVEALAQRHFGLGGLQEICREILMRGHDVQLHIHPNFRRVEWRQLDLEPLPGFFSSYPVDEQTAMLEEGIEVLTRAGVSRNRLRAFRAGDYAANEATWEAMLRTGLCLSSNYNLCHQQDGCDITSYGGEAGAFRPRPGLLELPITCFREPRGSFRHLQVSAVSHLETVATLRKAHSAGLGAVTLVTHPFEFFFIHPDAETIGRPNRIAWNRFRAICRFLGNNRAEFPTETLDRVTVEHWPELVGERGGHPTGSGWLRGLRLIEQGIQLMDRRGALA